jgi:hypothetical protein
VVRVALQNAASVAGLMITTEVMITELPEENPPLSAPPGDWESVVTLQALQSVNHSATFERSITANTEFWYRLFMGLPNGHKSPLLQRISMLRGVTGTDYAES